MAPAVRSDSDTWYEPATRKGVECRLGGSVIKIAFPPKKVTRTLPAQTTSRSLDMRALESKRSERLDSNSVTVLTLTSVVIVIVPGQFRFKFKKVFIEVASLSH